MKQANSYSPPHNSAANPQFDIDSLPEWQLLSGYDVAATPEAASGQFDLDAEKKRTQCSLNCLRYLYEGGDENYAALTEVQNEAVRLTREQFDELNNWFTETLDEHQSFETMQYIMLIHDIGKSGRVFDEMGIDPKEVDHDEVLTSLLGNSQYAAQQESLLPSYGKFPEEEQKLIQRIFGIRLNYAQFLQTEGPAASLEAIPEDLEEKTRSMYVMHAMLDLAGVVGHVNPDSSIVLTFPTYMSMSRATAALSSTELSGATERYNTYLEYRAQQLGVNTQELGTDQIAEAKAQVRLGCMLRYASPEQFEPLKEAYDNLALAVKTILTTELNKTGIDDRATLPYYGPALLKALSEQHQMETALTYFAHILQEAHIADIDARRNGKTGVVTAELGDLTRALNQGTLKLEDAIIRFNRHGNMFVPEIQKQSLDNLNSLPMFEGYTGLHDKRVLFVGMGGGSDGLQAAMLSKIFEEKYGSKTSAIVSVRNGEKPLTNPGERVSSALVEITKETEAASDWRFLEAIPFEDGSENNRIFILTSTDPEVVQQNIRELADMVNAEIVVGVDTGGDSLYRSDNNPNDGVTTSPDQDIAVLSGLARLEEHGSIEKVYSVVIAPGIDSPTYALETMENAGAARVVLSDSDKAQVSTTYAKWRMDGSASEEGRFGKTPLAWLKAIEGARGLSSLDLPTSRVVSITNPWRSFINITPAMGEIVIMDAVRHNQLVQIG